MSLKQKEQKKVAAGGGCDSIMAETCPSVSEQRADVIAWAPRGLSVLMYIYLCNNHKTFSDVSKDEAPTHDDIRAMRLHQEVVALWGLQASPAGIQQSKYFCIYHCRFLH